MKTVIIHIEPKNTIGLKRRRFMKRKILALVLAATMIGSLTACGSNTTDGGSAAKSSAKSQTGSTASSKTGSAASSKTGSAATSTTGKHYKFGYTCMDGTNPFFVTIQDKMKELITAKGDELVTTDPGNDVTKQISQVEDMLSQNLDGIFMNPVDAQGIIPALDQIKEANVPIVGFDTQVGDMSYLVSYTGSNNYNAGKVVGDDLVKKCPKGGKIIILDSPTMQSVVDRTNGFLDAIKDHGFEIVAEDLLQAHGDVVAIFGGNDPTALGALAAANAAGIKKGKCLIYGIDGSPDIKKELASGTSLIEGTGAQSPVAIAEKAVEIMYNHVEGKSVDKEYPVDTFLITSDNVKDYGTDGWQ